MLAFAEVCYKLGLGFKVCRQEGERKRNLGVRQAVEFLGMKT